MEFIDLDSQYSIIMLVIEQERNGKIVVFTGPEGSGKTTQGRLYAKRMGVPFIGFGDILRDKAANDPGKVGQACRDMFEKHTYLDPSLLVQIAAERITQNDIRNGAVLDGAFRSLYESENLSRLLRESGKEREDVVVVYLRIPGWRSIERLTEGRKREDDTPDGVLGRLRMHYSDLGTRMTVVKNNWRFVQVNAGKRFIEEIHQEILSKVS